MQEVREPPLWGQQGLLSILTIIILPAFEAGRGKWGWYLQMRQPHLKMESRAGPGDVPQLAGCLLSMTKSCLQSPAPHKWDWAVNTSDISTQEVEAGGSKM